MLELRKCGDGRPGILVFAFLMMDRYMCFDDVWDETAWNDVDMGVSQLGGGCIYGLVGR